MPFPRRRRKLRKWSNNRLEELRDTLIREMEDDKLDLQQDLARQTERGDNKFDIRREAAFDNADIKKDQACIDLVQELIDINNDELASSAPQA